MLRRALIVLLLWPLSSYSQDDLVDFDLVNFHSQAEKIAFTNYVRKGQPDHFALFMANGSLLNDSRVAAARTRLYNFLANYQNEKFSSKKPDRKTKQVYDEMHKEFLLKFENGTSFEQIFYNGNYSSLAATGMYALAFDHLKIPYAIKEEPDHVYLMAYPQTEKIRIEVTSPMLQILAPSDEFKAQYVKTLKDQKLILPAEHTQSTKQIFEKYFYGDQQGITLPNLVGLQYLAQVVQLLQENSYEIAFAQAEKAYLLYPSPKAAYFMMVAGSGAFDKRTQLDSLKAIQLAKISRYTSQGITPEMIQSEFIRVAQVLLFERSKPSELEAFYKILHPRIQHVGLKNDIDFVFNYETGRFFYNSAKYSEALPYFEKAVRCKPDMLDATNGFISVIAMKMSQTGDNRDLLKMLESYSSELPSLHEHNNFNSILMGSYLLQVAADYDNNAIQQAEGNRLRFEELKSKYPDAQTNVQLVAQAYSRAAVYFFRKGQKQKARTLIDTGLKYSPNNYELMMRKRMME